MVIHDFLPNLCCENGLLNYIILLAGLKHLDGYECVTVCFKIRWPQAECFPTWNESCRGFGCDFWDTIALMFPVEGFIVGRNDQKMLLCRFWHTSRVWLYDCILYECVSPKRQTLIQVQLRICASMMLDYYTSCLCFLFHNPKKATLDHFTHACLFYNQMSFLKEPCFFSYTPRLSASFTLPPGGPQSHGGWDPQFQTRESASCPSSLNDGFLKHQPVFPI